MQALPSGHYVTDLPPTFPCAQCEKAIYHDQLPHVTNGYAVRSTDNEMICYDCAAANDLDHAATTGKLFAYVRGVTYAHTKDQYTRKQTHWYYVRVADDASITTWPGRPLNIGRIYACNAWQSNFNDVRISIYCHLPTGENGTLQTWHGTYYASAGDYCRLTRTKNQLPNKDSRT